MIPWPVFLRPQGGITGMPFICTAMSANTAVRKAAGLICLSPAMTVFPSFFPVRTQKHFSDLPLTAQTVLAQSGPPSLSACTNDISNCIPHPERIVLSSSCSAYLTEEKASTSPPCQKIGNNWKNTRKLLKNRL